MQNVKGDEGWNQNGMNLIYNSNTKLRRQRGSPQPSIINPTIN